MTKVSDHIVRIEEISKTIVQDWKSLVDKEIKESRELEVRVFLPEQENTGWQVHQSAIQRLTDVFESLGWKVFWRIDSDENKQRGYLFSVSVR